MTTVSADDVAQTFTELRDDTRVGDTARCEASGWGRSRSGFSPTRVGVIGLLAGFLDALWGASRQLAVWS
ncbi:hypothetical protein [Streptomyces sp. NBC_00996]|uniref:hypothetical protein n=1 Tax=Streptomyces sp. NBC_00996 TaxID=2903710 RepID=UPI00386CB4F0|nr:hypothetical protein OG390_49370 [Streptomyces sp. NBC_00996]